MVVFKQKQNFFNRQAESKKNKFHVTQPNGENAFHNWRDIV